MTEFRASTTVQPARRVVGAVGVPGDKSISHRYAILGALAEGPTEIRGYAPGADCASTLGCLGRLGVEITRPEPAAAGTAPDEAGTIRITGRGLRGLRPAADPVDAGNSGTLLRLLAGVVAAHPFDTTLTGDQSLRSRPMMRIVRPLGLMGADIRAAEGGRPPLVIRGATLCPIDYTPDTASAQVKSAILLAALQSPGRTVVREIAATRDHTERALRTFGARVETAGLTVALEGEQPLRGQALTVPGDVSSATFWAVAAAALPGSEVEIRGVGLNPSRTAIFDVLGRMGARVALAPDQTSAEGEPTGTVRVAHGPLQGIEIAPAEVPGLIDELPALAVLATYGGGLRVTGAGELRAKESDRITALVNGLRALGADAEELADGFVVRPGPLAGGRVEACDDHRLAMVFAIAALGARAPVVVYGADAADVSYPGFFATLESLCQW